MANLISVFKASIHFFLEVKDNRRNLRVSFFGLVINENEECEEYLIQLTQKSRNRIIRYQVLIDMVKTSEIRAAVSLVVRLKPRSQFCSGEVVLLCFH